MKTNAWKEKFMQGVFLVAACTSVLAVALSCFFLLVNGIPAMKEIGFIQFITGDIWKPNNELFGIFPMIVGSLYVTAGAIIFGVPIGILTSIFMAMYCPKVLYKPLKEKDKIPCKIYEIDKFQGAIVNKITNLRPFGQNRPSRTEPNRRAPAGSAERPRQSPFRPVRGRFSGRETI